MTIIDMRTKHGARPLLKNYGEPKEGEIIVECDGCEEDCIRRPAIEEKALAFFPNMVFLCTSCVLKRMNEDK